MKSGDSTRLLETGVSFWMLNLILHDTRSLAAAEFCGLAAKVTEKLSFQWSDHSDVALDLGRGRVGKCWRITAPFFLQAFPMGTLTSQNLRHPRSSHL
jgi:hypothetical protein